MYISYSQTTGDIYWIAEKPGLDSPTDAIVEEIFDFESKKPKENSRFYTYNGSTFVRKPQEFIDDYKKQKYSKFRRAEYPSLEQLADAIYWQSNGDNSKMETYLAAIDAVKLKYPKE